MKEEKIIKNGSMLLMILGLLAWIVWVYKMLSFTIPVFFRENYWQDLGMVEDHITIGLFPWLAYAALWLGILALGTWAYYCAMRLLWSFWKGDYFSGKTLKGIFHLGLSLVITMLWDTLVSMVDQTLLTWNNTGQGGVMPDGAVVAAKMPLPISFHYDSGDISLLLCGFGFCLIGYVLGVAKRIETENKEFV